MHITANGDGSHACGRPSIKTVAEMVVEMGGEDQARGGPGEAALKRLPLKGGTR